MSNIEIGKCQVCDGEIRSKGAATCSRECSSVLKRKKTYEKRVCRTCTTEFEERVRRERAFCSDACRKKWQSNPENIEKRIHKSKVAMLEKYGVETSFQIKEVRERATDEMRKTLKKNGHERSDKIASTKLSRYGDKSFNNHNLSKKTKLDRYGDANFNNRDEARKTMLEKFGHEHAMMDPAFVEKARKTLMNNHGVDSPLRKKEFKEKSRNTNIERYGVEHYNLTDEGKRRITNTWRARLENTKQYSLINQLGSNDIELVGEFVGFRNPMYDGGDYIEYDFRCLKCKNEFKRKFCNPTIPICRVCYPSPKSPKTHELIRNVLKREGIRFVENSRRHINGYELDFVIEDLKLAIEINGNYFHSERSGEKDREYHMNKTVLAHAAGIRLLHVFEDEIIRAPEIVESRLMSLIGSAQMRIGARKCKVVELSAAQKRAFLQKHHIQGDSPSSAAFGLSYEGTIVSVMTFGGKRASLGNKKRKDGSYELIRFCNAIGHQVTGSFSKLMKTFIERCKPLEVTTFADIRWSGYEPGVTVYAKNGFTFDGFSRPNYWYFKKGDYMTRYHRFKFRKDVLVKEVMKLDAVVDVENVKQLSEWDMEKLMGMDSIWDCGSMRF